MTEEAFKELAPDAQRRVARRVQLMDQALLAGRKLQAYEDWWPELAPLRSQERDHVRGIIRREYGMQG